MVEVDAGLDFRVHEVYSVPDLLLPLLFLELQLSVVLILSDLILQERSIRIHHGDCLPTQLELHG